MGFTPSTDLLHKAQARRDARIDFHASQLTSKLALQQRYTGTSKRAAKRDKNSLHKAKAWHCKPLHINVILRSTKLSRIDWI
jgi:hypothetical protein